MSALADSFENTLVDFLLRGQPYIPPQRYYVGLLIGATSDAQFGAEVAGGGYARFAISCSMDNWSGTQGTATTAVSSGSSGTTTNNIAIIFPEATANWGLVTNFALYEVATGGTPKIYGTLVTPSTIVTGDPSPTFRPGDLLIQLDN